MTTKATAAWLNERLDPGTEPADREPYRQRRKNA